MTGSALLSPQFLEIAGLGLAGGLLVALAITDWRHQILPDILTGALLASGLIFALLNPHADFTYAAVSAAAGAGAFWLIRIGYQTLRKREGLGLGDVKLMAGLGAWAGLVWLPLLVLVAASGGLIYALILGLRKDGAISATTALPFGTFLCAGAGVVAALKLMAPALI